VTTPSTLFALDRSDECGAPPLTDRRWPSFIVCAPPRKPSMGPRAKRQPRRHSRGEVFQEFVHRAA